MKNADQVDDRVAVGEGAGEVRSEVTVSLHELELREHEQVAGTLAAAGHHPDLDPAPGELGADAAADEARSPENANLAESA